MEVLLDCGIIQKATNMSIEFKFRFCLTYSGAKENAPPFFPSANGGVLENQQTLDNST